MSPSKQYTVTRKKPRYALRTTMTIKSTVAGSSPPGFDGGPVVAVTGEYLFQQRHTAVGVLAYHTQAHHGAARHSREGQRGVTLASLPVAAVATLERHVEYIPGVRYATPRVRLAIPAAAVALQPDH